MCISIYHVAPVPSNLDNKITTYIELRFYNMLELFQNIEITDIEWYITLLTARTNTDPIPIKAKTIQGDVRLIKCVCLKSVSVGMAVWVRH